MSHNVFVRTASMPLLATESTILISEVQIIKDGSGVPVLHSLMGVLMVVCLCLTLYVSHRISSEVKFTSVVLFSFDDKDSFAKPSFI